MAQVSEERGQATLKSGQASETEPPGCGTAADELLDPADRAMAEAKGLLVAIKGGKP